LRAFAELSSDGLIDIDGDTDLQSLADIWSSEAPKLFEVSLDAGEAQRRGALYLSVLGIDEEAPAVALPDGPVRYHALALNADGSPIEVMHSDEGFHLFFSEPPTEQLAWIVDSLFEPFPAGILTPVGPVVANPAYADREAYETFSQDAYHGAVVWSWQQAMLAAGLDKQLKRSDLSPELRATLNDAQERLWQAIDAVADAGGSELWGWSYEDGFRVRSFGQGEGSVTEGNAAQLWSTVYLGIPRPDRTEGAAE
ncbi:MAG: hypothetical protein V2I43_17130, partial [Parvularcula sp.]|nr:hypothetical protein [Parvularcula sp.]